MEITTIKFWLVLHGRCRAPPWSSGNVLDHRSLPPVFESRSGHIWRLFRLLLRLITLGGRSAHLASLVHKSGRKTSTIINMDDFTKDLIDEMWRYRISFWFAVIWIGLKHSPTKHYNTLFNSQLKYADF